MAINLSKGQAISLKKGGDSSALNKCFAALGWDTGTSSIDLDASVVCFDEEKSLLESETVWYGHKANANMSIKHSGDNVTGDGEGDDEVIECELFNIPKTVKYAVVTISSYSGQKFTTVRNAFCRVVESKNRSEVCRYELSTMEAKTGIIVGMFVREETGWQFKAIGQFADSKTYKDLVRPIQELL